MVCIYYLFSNNCLHNCLFSSNCFAKAQKLSDLHLQYGRHIMANANDGVEDEVVEDIESEEEVEVPVFDEDRDMNDPQLQLGMIFPNAEDLVRFLKEFHTRNGIGLKFRTHEPTRISVGCKNSQCQFILYATDIRGNPTSFQIKTLAQHTCRMNGRGQGHA